MLSYTLKLYTQMFNVYAYFGILLIPYKVFIILEIFYLNLFKFSGSCVSENYKKDTQGNVEFVLFHIRNPF